MKCTKVFIFIGEQCPIDYGQFPITNAHIVLPNASKCTNELDKKILQSTMEHKNVQDYNGRSGLHFIKFDFLISCWEIKIAMLLPKFFNPSVIIFISLYYI